MLLNNQYIAEEIKEEKTDKEKTRGKWKWNHNNPKSTRYSKASSKREGYSSTILPQETRKLCHLTFYQVGAKVIVFLDHEF